MAYRPIGQGVQRLPPPDPLRGWAQAFMQGRQLGEQRKRREWQQEKYEEQIAREQQLREQKELEVKKQLLESTRLRGMRSLKRAQAQPEMTPETLAGLEEQEEARYQQAIQKLGVPLSELEAPSLFAPATREEALQKGVGALQAAIDPTVSARPVTAERPLPFGQMTEIQAQRAAERGPDKRELDIDRAAASALAAKYPGQGWERVEHARGHPEWAFFKQQQEDLKRARVPKEGDITFAPVMTMGGAKEIEHATRVGEHTLNKLLVAAETAGAQWNPKTQKLVGGDFERVSGLITNLGHTWSTFKDYTGFGSLSKEDREAYQRINNFRKTLGRVTIEEFHEFFGSALTISEMERARDKLIDPKLPPAQLRDALENYIRLYNGAIMIDQELYNKGMRDRRDPDRAAAFDMRFRAKMEGFEREITPSAMPRAPEITGALPAGAPGQFATAEQLKAMTPEEFAEYKRRLLAGQ